MHPLLVRVLCHKIIWFRSCLAMIRSYVKREGRLTTGQKKALEKYYNKYVLDINRSFEPEKIYPNKGPLILDIGSGMGDTTVKIAAENPENNYLAVEVHTPGVGGLLRQLNEHKLDNVRVIKEDVIKVLHTYLPDNCIDCVFIFFPDPWPKKRHHKRRLINQDLLKYLQQKLKSNARIYVATDWQNYAEHINDVFNASKSFINMSANNAYAPHPYWRPQTKFELRGEKQGHVIYDLAFILH